jgi:hypothetical protein
MLNGLRTSVSKVKAVAELFEGRHFDREVIILCVRWYLRFKLSLTPRSSRNAGAGLPVRSAAHGELTKPTSRSEASGATCTVPLTGRAGPLISG